MNILIVLNGSLYLAISWRCKVSEMSSSWLFEPLSDPISLLSSWSLTNYTSKALLTKLAFIASLVCALTIMAPIRKRLT